MHSAILVLGGVGFLVGFRHAFEPDHLAAVAPLSTRHGWRGASTLGVAWGLGHSASIALVALVIALLGIRVPAKFFRAAELGVAALLVALGVSTLVAEARRHMTSRGPAHRRAHLAEQPHSHAGRRTAWGALSFGVVHGLAGSGAVMVLLVAAARNVGQQMAYLLVFGVGTIVGMSAVSLTTGALSGFASARSARVATVMRVGAASASVIAGTLLGASTLQPT